LSDLAFVVSKIVAETPSVRSLVLEAASASPLPAWRPGAHIRLKLPNGADRPYSLVDLAAWRTGRHYVLGVRREPDSTGGSQFVHALREGDRVEASAPINRFELQDGAGEVLLLAGGIGITPILSMAAACARSGRPFKLHYLGRTRGELAFLDELRAICGESLIIHYDDGPSGRPDFAALIAGLAPAADLYVCGPTGMIDAVKAVAGATGHPPERLFYELFTPTPAAGECPFEVEIKSTGQVVTVGAEQSIIDALTAAGIDVVYDCRRGDCGICQTGVLAGTPDHRDVVLTAEEKASNKVMQICVSRSKSPRLVLDL
jgi:ferredoxin-NADP reductase